MTRHGALILTALISVALVWSAQAQPARFGASTTPASARATVTTFFRALGASDFAEACSLLGRELLAETGGPNCPAFLRFGMPEPLRWSIRGVRTTRGGVGVVVRLGQNDLDRVRMRTWLAVVRSEQGSARIVETRLLA